MIALSLILLLIPAITSLNVTIIAPRLIQALSNDVSVSVMGAEREDVVELYYDDGDFPITAQIITEVNIRDGHDVTTVFNCGYFSRLGNYTVVVKRRDDDEGNLKYTRIAKSQMSATKWSNISIIMKSQHEAYSGDVKVAIKLSRDVCRSEVALQYKTRLVLLRDNKIVMVTHDVSFPHTTTFFECDVFSLNGSYVTQLHLLISDDESVISESKIMTVEWSSDYKLHVPDVRLPCSDSHIVIGIGKPPCAPSDDLIQLVAVFNNGTNYVIKSVEIGSGNSIQFSCEDFFVSSQGVCFRYVTSNTTVKSSCRGLRGQNFNVNGDWAIWSHWTTCSKPCTVSKRQRFRSCDNPRPQGLGAHCDDVGMDHKSQVINLSNDVIKCPYETDGNRNESDCLCGCSLLVLSSQLLVSPVSGECYQQQVLEWRFSTLLGQVLQLSLIDFHPTSGESLILVEDLKSTSLTSHPHLTKSNTVLFRYTRSSRGSASCGFSLFIQPINHILPITTLAPLPGDDETKTWFDSLLDNPVVVIAVCVCLLVVVVASSAAVCHCRKQQRKNLHRKLVSLESRSNAPPDGKSSSNVDTESDHPQLLDAITPKPPRAAYYLAQRQLQVMKKDGKANSSQLYTSLCMNDCNIKEQEDLLFGDLTNQKETKT